MKIFIHQTKYSRGSVNNTIYSLFVVFYFLFHLYLSFTGQFCELKLN